MKSKEVKDYGKSVKSKLVNLMNESGFPYMYLLVRYLNERVLYRVSVSRYRDNFLLKGGSLLYALNGLETRPTIDVDFMAMQISNDREHLLGVFSEILSIRCLEDGVSFDVASLKADPITVDHKYPGTRFSFVAKIDTIRQAMTMDVGFGDVVSPEPTSINYPLLLPNMSEFSLCAYTVETVIAEKFHAILDRGMLNSRMKDFFDCYMIFTSRDFDVDVLYEAIRATLTNRNFAIHNPEDFFSEGFAKDEILATRWNAFLKKIKWKDPLPFDSVVSFLQERLYVFYNRYSQQS